MKSTPPTTSQVSPTNSEHHTLVPGDNVRVELGVEIFKMMQDGHGDCDDYLLSVRKDE